MGAWSNALHCFYQNLIANEAGDIQLVLSISLELVALIWAFRLAWRYCAASRPLLYCHPWEDKEHTCSLAQRKVLLSSTIFRCSEHTFVRANYIVTAQHSTIGRLVHQAPITCGFPVCSYSYQIDTSCGIVSCSETLSQALELWFDLTQVVPFATSSPSRVQLSITKRCCAWEKAEIIRVQIPLLGLGEPWFDFFLI